MSQSKSSFLQKVLVGLFCAIFLVGSAVPVLGASKKPKKDKKDMPVASEEPAAIDVEVYAEGAYTTGGTGDLAVYIYADIIAGDICSYGVKLSYDITKLESPVAEKNEDVWYMGTTGDKKPYMDPEINTETGEIIFIGGKLDEDSPTAGVTGTRILLGKVTFSRLDDYLVVDPDSYFGIELELGRPDPDPPDITFDNFVTTDGVVKDGNVDFVSVIVKERGDANKDDVITNLDMFAIRSILSSGGSYEVFADCNDDDVITNLDMFCVRGKL